MGETSCKMMHSRMYRIKRDMFRPFHLMKGTSRIAIYLYGLCAALRSLFMHAMQRAVRTSANHVGSPVKSLTCLTIPRLEQDKKRAISLSRPMRKPRHNAVYTHGLSTARQTDSHRPPQYERMDFMAICAFFGIVQGTW